MNLVKKQKIFNKSRLTPDQLRAVAELRFGDAKCLLDSGDQARANGVLYVSGFVIECLLKSLLLERHRNLQRRVDPAKLSSSDKEVYDLLYRRHGLHQMLIFLPEVKMKLKARGESIWLRFEAICEEWTVYVRYSSIRAKLNEDAKPFLETVKEVKQWLKEMGS